jgi:hypothetical protein
MTTANNQRELTRIYDILAGINDAVEVGDDGYARFGSVNDRDRLRDLVQELEPAALAFHGAQTHCPSSATSP